MKLDIVDVQKHESCLHNTFIVKCLMSWMLKKKREILGLHFFDVRRSSDFI